MARDGDAESVPANPQEVNASVSMVKMPWRQNGHPFFSEPAPLLEKRREASFLFFSRTFLSRAGLPMAALVQNPATSSATGGKRRIGVASGVKRGDGATALEVSLMLKGAKPAGISVHRESADYRLYNKLLSL